jgi:hypothetical protein
MRNHHVPTIVEVFEHVVLNVRPLSLRWQNIARPRIVASGAEGITYNTAELASDQDSQSTLPKQSGEGMAPPPSCRQMKCMRFERSNAAFVPLPPGTP